MSPLQATLINDTLFMTSLQDSQPFSLARVYKHTSVIVVLGAKITLRCHGTGARLSPRATFHLCVNTPSSE